GELVVIEGRVVRIHGTQEVREVVGDPVAPQRLAHDHVGIAIVDVVVDVGDQGRVFIELNGGVVAETLEFHREGEAGGVGALVHLLASRVEQDVVEQLGAGRGRRVERHAVVAAGGGVGSRSSVPCVPHSGDEAGQPRRNGGTGGGAATIGIVPGSTVGEHAV